MESQNQSNTRWALQKVGIGFAVSILAGVGLFIWIGICAIISGIAFGMMMTTGTESEVHSAVSPDRRVTALVVSDDCGITCGCTVRVDLKTNDKYLRSVWRGNDVCDATVTWISSTELQIRHDKDQKIRLDIHTLGLAP